MKRYRDLAGDGGSDIVAQLRAQAERIERRLADVRRVVAVASGKGGVGKSTLTGGLAVAFAVGGWRVGVLDADLHGPSMAKILGVRGRRLVVGPNGVEPPIAPPGIKVMSMDLLLVSDASPVRWEAPTQAEAYTWRGALEAQALREFLADTAWGVLDVLLVDLPPGSDRLTSIVGLIPRLSGAVVVTLAADLAQLVVRRALAAVRETGTPVLGIVENMAGLFPGPDVIALAEEAGVPLLGRVPFDGALALAADRGDPYVASAPESEAARAIRGVAAGIRQALGDAPGC